MDIAFVSAQRENSWKTDLANAFEFWGHGVTHFHDRYLRARPHVYDLVIWAYNHNRPPHFRPDVSVTMDLWLGVQKRERQMYLLRHALRNFWTAPYVFTADGNPAHQAQFEAMGISHYWLPPACPSRLVFTGEPQEADKGAKVVFVGSRAHWNPLRRQMIQLLSDRYGSAFRWYGTRSPLGPRWDASLNDLYATNAIVIGDSMNVDYYWSDRIPRTLGQGGFLLTAQTAGFGVAGLFEGEQIATWSGVELESLVDQIDYYLDQPIKRYQIASQGREVVKQRHLWEHRAKRILEVVGERPQSATQDAQKGQSI